MNCRYEYIWADKSGQMRSKVRVLSAEEAQTIDDVSKVPLWNFDGSSTGQDFGENTEVILKPVRLYNDPFTNMFQKHKLVLCELDLKYDGRSEELNKCNGLPGFNTRYWGSHIAERYQDLDPWFGLEQEYVFTEKYFDKATGQDIDLPYHWENLSREGQGNYYCGVQYPHSECNEVARKHLDYCMKMGIKISGINAEVLPNQWEFQIGPADLLRAGDDLLMARYLLYRLAGEKGLGVSFHPKVVVGEWNGSGCHLNFSTNQMRKTRNGDGMKVIREAVNKLETDHPRILKFYGVNNELRLTGKHETSSMDVFSWGIGTRNTSVRIPTQVSEMGGGYLEDRRPASNIDPYYAMGALLDVTCGI